MKVAFDCIPCTVQSCLRLLDEGCIAEDQRERLLRRTLLFLAETDWEQSPPAMARELHAQLRREAGVDDPYREIKQRSNRAMIDRLEDLRGRLSRADDPFATAVRLAVAGNVIDFGARHLFDPDRTIERVVTADLAIDHTEKLRADLDAARSVLYIGDNAGEIVLDGLFLETLARPDVTFVVRGGPVLNDATTVDADLVGISDHARLMTTGDDSPGVILDRSSGEFRRAFERSDVVIAKGQGNLEGLWDASREVYFLLTVKCERIARHIGAPVGEFVVWKYRPSDASPDL